MYILKPYLTGAIYYGYELFSPTLHKVALSKLNKSHAFALLLVLVLVIHWTKLFTNPKICVLCFWCFWGRKMYFVYAHMFTYLTIFILKKMFLRMSMCESIYSQTTVFLRFKSIGYTHVTNQADTHFARMFFDLWPSACFLKLSQLFDMLVRKIIRRDVTCANRENI